MNILIESYDTQIKKWPRIGRNILAQFDANSIIVYQAYNSIIGHYAVRNQFFGGQFNFSRMSWIKTNFLWMMYRSGWGTKIDQEFVLAIRIARIGFDRILELATHSSFIEEIYKDRSLWSKSIASSPVRVQWDPDHDAMGKKTKRRAIQLGLRGDILSSYARDWIIEIKDISDFVRQQRQYALAQNYTQLVTPQEMIYPVNDLKTANKLGISTV